MDDFEIRELEVIGRLFANVTSHTGLGAEFLRESRGGETGKGNDRQDSGSDSDVSSHGRQSGGKI